MKRLGGTKTARDERKWLRGFIRFAIGDVSLDGDEAAFVAAMAAIAGDAAKRLPSAIERQRIRGLSFRLWYTPDDPVRLTPRSGFDWEKVRWSPPGAPPDLDECSYCTVPIHSDDKPMPWRRDDGWRAFFCDQCQEVWFGVLEPLPATVHDL